MSEQTDKVTYDELNYIIIDFCIPYAFKVVDSEINIINQKSHQVIVNGISAIINIEKVFDYRYKEEQGIKIKARRQVKGDRHGTNAYSKVQVWFDENTFSQEFFDRKFLLFSGNLDTLAKRAVDYVNKFIREYRELSREFWMRPINLRELSACRVIALSKDGRTTSAKTTLEEVDIKFLEKPQILTHEETERLRNMLLCEDYDFRSEIFLDALDFQSLGKKNLALLLAVTRFENFVYKELKNLLSRTKLDKIKKKDPCQCMVGITGVCTKGFKEHFDLDFESTLEWRELRDNALRPRNKIVHGEIEEEISDEMCHEALKSVQAAEVYLHNHLFLKQASYVFPKIRN